MKRSQQKLCLPVVLAVLGLALAPLAATAQPGVENRNFGGEVSPDGVELWNLNKHSKLWSRTFTLDVPDGVTAADLYHLCGQEAAKVGLEVSLMDCLLPFIKDLEWAPGRINPLDRDGGLGNAPLPAFIIAPPPGVRLVTLQPNEFFIHDNVDCCDNANADAYVVYTYFTAADQYAEITVVCRDQDTSSGWCHAPLTVESKEQGTNTHNIFVEFWDEDVTSDDQMDVSNVKGQATAKIRLSKTSNGWRWWADEGQSSPGLGACLNQPAQANSFCGLTGEYDATGDHDDATLEFTLYVQN